MGLPHRSNAGLPVKHRLVTTAGITAAMQAAGAVAGLALDALILFSFGAGRQTDALFAALTVPTLLNGIVSIQGPKILIPVFSTLFERREETKAWELLRNLLTTCGLLFGGVVLAGVLLSGIIMPLQIPGVESDTIALSVGLSRVLFALVWCQGTSSILQAVLFARHSYFVSSAGRFVVNVVTIAVVLGAGYGQFGIETVAWGMVLGNVVQIALLVMVLAAQGFRYRWVLETADPTLRGVLTSFGYPLAGHVLGESGVIIQNVLGSFLGSGSLTLLRYGARIIQTIGAILLGSVVQVTLPMMARHAATSDLAGQRRTLLESIQILSLVGVPLSIWLIFAAEPLVMLFFQRGQFSLADAATTAVIVRVMVPQFLVSKFVNVSQQLFYANDDQRTPFVSTVIYAVANAVVAVVLGRWLGERGIGMAVSIASMCNAVYMLSMLQRRFAPIGWSGMRTFAWRLGGISVLAATGFVVGARLASLTAAPEQIARFLAVAVPGLLGFAVFLAGVFAFRLFDAQLIAPVAGTVTEADEAQSPVTTRFRGCCG